MRSPPPLAGFGDSRPSPWRLSLKREDSDEESEANVATALSYRSCSLTQCTSPAPACAPPPAKSRKTHPVPHRSQLGGAAANLRANRLISLELWVSDERG